MTSCTAGLQRGSIFAIKRESTAGDLVIPSAASDFIPLKSGFAMEYSVEELKSDELLADEGQAKGTNGFESVSGSHGAYAKTSEIAGTEADCGLLYESCLGGVSTEGTEYLTTSSSTTSLIKLASGGSSKEVGEAVMVKDTLNGYSIRNIDTISTNDLTPNFNLAVAPGTGMGTGKAVLYKPGTSHPAFSAWLYNGNGFAVQAAAGCKVSDLSMKFEAGKQAEVEFKYEGGKYYFNPLIVTAGVNDTFNITDPVVTDAKVTIAPGIYDAVGLATEITTALDDATTKVHTCTYSNTTGLFNFTATDSVSFSILWNTGANTSAFGTLIGFSVAADSTGALTYTSATAQSYAASYTPSYDVATNLVVKDAELFIGDSTNNVCRCAKSVSLSISTPTVSIESICSPTGIQSKEILSREVTLEAEMILNKFDVLMFNKMKNNSGLKAMLNVGPKSSGGDWVPGKCLNVYLRNCTVSKHNITGDDFIMLNVTLKGFVTSTSKDVYINMI